MNERRKNMVLKAFAILDKTGDGKITVEDVKNIYDVTGSADFAEKRLTKEQIVSNFINSFEGKHGNKDGTITLDEFIDYYSDVSQSIPGDEMFIQMMEQTWQCPEHENTKEVQANVNLLLKEVRAKILDLANGDLTRLKKIFTDFDTNLSGSLTLDETTTMIAKLRISVERKMVYPYFKLIDRDNSGAIEFEEFENYILNKN